MAKRKSQELDSFETTPSVKIKVEGHPTDYSEDVKKKLSTASRTSTACDRCRIRKMRCDDRPDGCAPCRQNQTECKTTDRLTGKATVRGYVENLERRIQELESHNRQLQNRVVSLGGDVSIDDPFVHSNANPHSLEKKDHTDQNVGTQFDSLHVNGHKQTASDTSYDYGDAIHLPDFRSGLAGNNYVGVSSRNSLLSSIQGTSMNVLGMQIDLADYASADIDEPDASRADAQPVYNKSYRACIQTAFGTSPKLSKVELPPRKEGLEYGEIYLTGINPYVPILHKPTFMKILTRMYDDPNFRPSIAEIVMVHTMFAIVHCQLAVRAAKDKAHKAELNHSSNFHYHYALGFFSQLMASHTLADVQALTLLGCHLRNFPKPGACWMIVSIILNLAIEVGLHRSAKSWAASVQDSSTLENEIRKRVFWTLLLLLVSVSGNLGRPLALRSEDWDVEMPELIDDEFISDDGMDTSKIGQCRFPVGLIGFRAIPIFIDVYNCIYTVKRSPQTYVDNVRGLERRIREWQEKWPREIVHHSASENELGHSHAQYLEIFTLHMRLLLRHPSLSLTSNVEFNNENLTICMDVSRKMLYHVKQLQKFISLDGTWQTAALYVLAISTTLFAHWERRENVTVSSLETLKADMNAWLSIIGDMGHYMGSGTKLQDTVRVATERTLKLLSHQLSSKYAPSPSISAKELPSSSTSHITQPSATIIQHQPTSYAAYEGSNDGIAMATPPRTNGHTNTFVETPNVGSHSTEVAYQNASQYQYQNQYTRDPSTFEQQAFAQPDPLPATAAAANAYMTSYQQPQAPTAFAQNSAYLGPSNYSPASPSAWRQFTGDITSNIDPSTDYLSSASALMQLGRDGVTSAQLPIDLNAQEASNIDGGHQQSWPFLLFENGHGVG